jgi:cysteine desulfurase
MRVPREIGIGAVRFSLGRTTTAHEIEAVVERLNSVLAELIAGSER